MSDQLDLILKTLIDFRDEFTQFKGETLDKFNDVDNNFMKVHSKFDQVDESFNTVHSKFDQVDIKFIEAKEDLNQFKEQNKAQLDRIEQRIVEIEKNQPEDIIALLSQINNKMDHREYDIMALNTRLFKAESDIEQLKQLP